MTDFDPALIEKAAQAIYDLNPDMQPWDGDPYHFTEANGHRKRLALKQAHAVLAAVAPILRAEGGQAEAAFWHQRGFTEGGEEALTSALHPEFGTEWREPGGVIWKEYQRGREDGRREAAGAIDFDTTCLNCAAVLEKSAKAYFDGEKAGMAEVKHWRESYQRLLKIEAATSTASYRRGMVDGARQVYAAVEKEANLLPDPQRMEAKALRRAAREAVVRIEREQS